MKKLSFIALLLAGLLCFGGCTSDETDTDDENEKIEDSDKENDEKDETTEEAKDFAAGTYTASFRLSSVEGDVSITFNEDNTFEITIAEDFSLGVQGIDALYLYTGTYTVDNGNVTCTSGRASFTLSSEDESVALAELKSYGYSDSEVGVISDALKTGTSLTDEDLGMIPYEKTVFKFTYENESLVIESTEEWYGDCEYAHFICTYENGIINTKTLYDRAGGITYVDYYVDGKLDHTVNYDVYGNPIN